MLMDMCRNMCTCVHVPGHMHWGQKQVLDGLLSLSFKFFFFNSGVYLWSQRSRSPLLGWKLVSSSNPSLLSLPTSISVLQLQGCPGHPACFRGAKIQAPLLTIAQQGLWNIDPSLWYLLLFILVSVFKVIFVVQSHTGLHEASLQLLGSGSQGAGTTGTGQTWLALWSFSRPDMETMRHWSFEVFPDLPLENSFLGTLCFY